MKWFLKSYPKSILTFSFLIIAAFLKAGDMIATEWFLILYLIAVVDVVLLERELVRFGGRTMRRGQSKITDSDENGS